MKRTNKRVSIKWPIIRLLKEKGKVTRGEIYDTLSKNDKINKESIISVIGILKRDEIINFVDKVIVYKDGTKSKKKGYFELVKDDFDWVK